MPKSTNEIISHQRGQTLDEAIELLFTRRDGLALDGFPLRQYLENISRPIKIEAAREMAKAYTLHDRAKTSARGKSDLMVMRRQRLGQRHHGMEMTVRRLESE